MFRSNRALGMLKIKREKERGKTNDSLSILFKLSEIRAGGEKQLVTWGPAFPGGATKDAKMRGGESKAAQL